MAGERISPEVIPPACRFFREIIADPHLTGHDVGLVAKHTRECAQCERVIGQMIHEKIESNMQAEK